MKKPKKTFLLANKERVRAGRKKNSAKNEKRKKKKPQGEREVFLKVISSATIGKNYILCTSRRRRRQKTIDTAAKSERWEMRPERCTQRKRFPGTPGRACGGDDLFRS
jgi:hypothetical protein